MPESYFHKLNEIITRHINTGNVARDATGMSDSRKKVWLDVRTGDKKIKKNWIKLHTLIDIPSRVVLCRRIQYFWVWYDTRLVQENIGCHCGVLRVILLMNITPGVTGDCPTMVEMIKRLPKFLKQANGCFDSAYLSRKFCNLLMSLNLTPFIKPKSNTKRNADGSWSWGEDGYYISGQQERI